MREKLRTKLLAEADAFKSARTNASLGRLLDRWLPQHDVDANTRESYESLIRVPHPARARRRTADDPGPAVHRTR